MTILLPPMMMIIPLGIYEQLGLFRLSLTVSPQLQATTMLTKRKGTNVSVVREIVIFVLKVIIVLLELPESTEVLVTTSATQKVGMELNWAHCS